MFHIACRSMPEFDSRIKVHRGFVGSTLKGNSMFGRLHFNLTTLTNSIAAVVLALCPLVASAQSGAPSGTLAVAGWMWQQPVRGEAIWSTLKRYENKNPGAKLDKVFVARASYEGSISTQLGAGQGPDIIIMSDTYFAPLAKAGLLEPVDDLLGAAEKKSLNSSNEFGRYHGKQLAYTFATVNYALFWNKSLLAAAGVKPPTNFEALLEAAVAIKAKTGVTGFAVRSQMNEEAAWWQDFANWIYGYGGQWSKNGKLTIDAPQNIQAVTAFKKMYDSGAMATGDDASTFRTKFGQGQIGIMIDNGPTLQSIVSGNSNPVKSSDVDAMRLPFPTAASANEIVLIGINKNSKNKALARDFLRWFVSPDAQTPLVAALGVNGVATDAPTPDSFLKANPWSPVFKTQAKDSVNSVIVGFEEKTPQIRFIVLSAISRVLSNNVDPATALRAAQAEAVKQFAAN